MNFEINNENLLFIFTELLQRYFNQKFFESKIIWITKYAKLKSQDIIENLCVYYVFSYLCIYYVDIRYNYNIYYTIWQQNNYEFIYSAIL